MSNFHALTFRDRFDAAFKNSNIESYSELSRKADLSRPMTCKILNGAYDHSKVGPGIFSVKRLADALNTRVGFLLAEDLATDSSSQNFFNGTSWQRGMLERLMETHWRGAGRLEAFSDFIEDCDLYEIPTDGQDTPKIKRVGSRTLFAGRLGGTFLRDAQRELDNMPLQTRLDAVAFHRRVLAEGTAIRNSFVDHKMVTRASHVRASNAGLGLLVTDNNEEQSILLHAYPIPV